MQITLVQNRKNYIHDKDSNQHQDRKIGNGILKRECLALETAMYVCRKNLLRGIFHELCCRPDGGTRFQVEEQSYAGELIRMVDALRPNDSVPTGKRAERHHALAIVTFDIQLAQVLRIRALVVRNLQDHLILISRLLDQVTVVLGVSVVQQVEDPALRYPIELGLFAQNVNLQVGRVIEKIRIHEQESGILVHPGGQLGRCSVHLILIDS